MNVKCAARFVSGITLVIALLIAPKCALAQGDYAPVTSDDVQRIEFMHYYLPDDAYRDRDFEWKFRKSTFVLRKGDGPIASELQHRLLGKDVEADEIRGKWKLVDKKGMQLVLSDIKAGDKSGKKKVSFPIYRTAPTVIRIGQPQYVFGLDWQTLDQPLPDSDEEEETEQVSIPKELRGTWHLRLTSDDEGKSYKSGDGKPQCEVTETEITLLRKSEELPESLKMEVKSVERTEDKQGTVNYALTFTNEKKWKLWRKADDSSDSITVFILDDEGNELKETDRWVIRRTEPTPEKPSTDPVSK